MRSTKQSNEKRFATTRANRQAILDFCERGQYYTHREIADALNMPRAVCYRACKAMTKDGEMSSRGSGAARSFSKLADETMPLETMIARAERREVRAPRPASRPGHYVNDPSSHPPLSSLTGVSQGGQGALRRSVTCQSSADLL